MLTPSVNLVQSSFPEELQGEISGLSRSVSNLGSCSARPSQAPSSSPAWSTGTTQPPMITLGVLGLVGLAAAWLLPANPVPQAAGDTVSPRAMRRA